MPLNWMIAHANVSIRTYRTRLSLKTIWKSKTALFEWLARRERAAKSASGIVDKDGSTGRGERNGRASRQIKKRKKWSGQQRRIYGQTSGQSERYLVWCNNETVLTLETGDADAIELYQPNDISMASVSPIPIFRIRNSTSINFSKTTTLNYHQNMFLSLASRRARQLITFQTVRSMLMEMLWNVAYSFFGCIRITREMFWKKWLLYELMVRSHKSESLSASLDVHRWVLNDAAHWSMPQKVKIA